jgi:hypothetical protein
MPKKKQIILNYSGNYIKIITLILRLLISLINAINDAWETDNDSDDDSLQDQLDGLTKSFLERPPDRGEPKRPT